MALGSGFKRLFRLGDPMREIAQPAALPPLVEEAPGRDVAILETDDPDITVLWFF